jgi:hypothetical protein
MTEHGPTTEPGSPVPAPPGTPAGADRSRREIADRYARFYAPLAVASAVLVFLPPFKDTVEMLAGALLTTESYGTLFDMAGRPAGGPAIAALLLSAAIIVLLAAAALHPVRSPWLPGWLAGLSTLVVIMLITKPATDHPPLSDAGRADLVVAACTVLLGLLHAVQLAALDRRSS